MVMRIKKPAVEPRKRREWFRRHEEDGEPIAQIAKADGYDVRTVKKLIQVEHQEREAKEARSLVLRQALEAHYADLCAFAQKLDFEVTKEQKPFTGFREDRMWEALREHLPKSAMWKSLDKLEQLQSEIKVVEDSIRGFAERALQEWIRRTPELKPAPSPKDNGLDQKKTLDALSQHLKEQAQEDGGGPDVGFEWAPVNERAGYLRWRQIPIGKFTADQAAQAEKAIGGLIDDVSRLPETALYRRLTAEARLVQRQVRDELAIIILKRVVSGKCRYCPI